MEFLSYAQVTLPFLVIISGCFIGILKAILESSLLRLLVCLELMFLAISAFFIFDIIFREDYIGVVYILLILTISACEMVVILGLIYFIYRIRGRKSLPINR